MTNSYEVPASTYLFEGEKYEPESLVGRAITHGYREGLKESSQRETFQREGIEMCCSVLISKGLLTQDDLDIVFGAEND